MKYDALPGLKVTDFEHPGEKTAMAVLRKIPLLDIVVAKYLDVNIQMSLFAEASGNYFRITEKTNPRVYNLYKLALKRLDMPAEYPLFSKLGYDYNAYTAGVDEPFVVLHSSMIANCSDEELLYVIGHELGHVKCGHTLYYNMASQLNSLLAKIGGIATAAAIGLQYAIMDWHRKAEFSADRAGLIAAGSIEGAYGGVLKLLGHTPNIPDVDFSIDKVLKQLSDFEAETDDLVGKLLYVSYTAQASHPWSILRLKQIKEWYDSGEYDTVIRNKLNAQ